MAHNAAWVQRVLEETRRQGYAIRDADYGADFDRTKRESDDALVAIAVPIRAGDRVVATMNLLWSERVASHREIARRYLKDLKAAAEDIARRLSDDTAK